MSDETALAKLSEAVRKTLEEFVPAVLEELAPGLWEMPTLQDFVCVFAIQDVGDGRGNTQMVFSRGLFYRRIGLLTEALMDLQADVLRDD